MTNDSRNRVVKQMKDIGDVALGEPIIDTAQTVSAPQSQKKPGIDLTVDMRADVPEEFLHMFEHDMAEPVLKQAVRHPYGVYVIYLIAAFAVLVTSMIIGFLSADSAAVFGAELSANTKVLMVLAGVIIFVISGLGGILSAYVYQKSRIILTNQKIVFIKYNSVFSRKISQLNLEEISDVNVSQPTIIDRVFKTGTITIETAGETATYPLTWVKDPYDFANAAVQIREKVSRPNRR